MDIFELTISEEPGKSGTDDELTGATMTATTSHIVSDSYDLRGSAILIADGGCDDAALRAAIDAAGLREIAGGDWNAAVTRIDTSADVILIETSGRDVAQAERVFDNAIAAARAGGAAVLATVPQSMLDDVADRWFDGALALLCEPGPADRILALKQLLQRRALRLNDVTRDAEAARLQRLNEEVARIADTLVRLTRGAEPDVGAISLREPPSGYRGPDQGNGHAVDIKAEEIRAVIRARRMRGQFFGDELFADPAWDMLLDLFAAELEGRRVSVSSLCIAAAVPPTTALRWIGGMHDAGLFERHADPDDRRRAYIALSGKGRDQMRAYVATLRKQGLTLV
tara:strand:- start:564 stop:1586 length:1023 start_codon:yes stop_codon:yes gene_type:complete